MADSLCSSETPSAPALPPHFRCDCVPDLGPAHCHRCSRTAESPIHWENSPCKDLVEGLAYTALLTARADAALLVVSEAFDAAQVGEHEEPVAPAVVPSVETTVPERPQAEQPPAERVAPPSAVPGPPQRRAVLISAQDRHEQNAATGNWRFTKLARDQIRDLGFTERELLTILEAPHVTTPAHTGTAMNHYGHGLLAMIDGDGECIISVIERETPIALGNASPGYLNDSFASTHVKQKTHSGGAGRRIPSNVKEFISMLNEHGFVTELGGKGHHLTVHPHHPEVRFSVPSSPSDTRSYLNTIADIKRRTGIDITKKKG